MCHLVKILLLSQLHIVYMCIWVYCNIETLHAVYLGRLSQDSVLSYMYTYKRH